MSVYRVFVWICGIALTLFLAACGSKLVDLTVFPNVTATIIESTEYYSELGSYTVAIPIKSMAQASQDEVAKELFSLWLDHFTSEVIDKRIRLDDYKIQDVTLLPEFQYCAKDLGIESIATVVFSVQTSNYPAPDWDAGTGTMGDDHWINNKSSYIAIFRKGDDYTFKSLGVPPCAGIAIDGSKVP